MSNTSSKTPWRNLVDARHAYTDAVSRARVTTRALRRSQGDLAKALARQKALKSRAAAMLLVGKPVTPRLAQSLDMASQEVRHQRGKVGGFGRALVDRKRVVGDTMRAREHAQSVYDIDRAQRTRPKVTATQTTPAQGGIVGSYSLPQPPAWRKTPSASCQDAASIVTGNIAFGSTAQADIALNNVAETISHFDASGILVGPKMQKASVAINSGFSPDLVWEEMRPVFGSDIVSFPYKGVVG